MADKIIFKTLMLKGDAGEPTDQQTQAAVDDYMQEHPEAAIDETIINSAVADWLDTHPEATTTVQDHSLTYEKLVNGTLGFVIPEMYGAVGDGVTDDSSAIEEASTHGILFGGGKTYYIGANCEIVNDIYDCKFIVSKDVSLIATKNNLTISDCEFSNDDYYPSTGRGYWILIIRNSNNAKINNCYFHKGVSALYVDRCNNVIISNNVFSDLRQMAANAGGNGYGVLCVESKILLITNNVFYNVARHSIYLSHDDDSTYNEDICIKNNVFKWDSGVVGNTTGYEETINIRPSKRIVISNNEFINMFGVCAVTSQSIIVNGSSVYASSEDVYIKNNIGTFNGNPKANETGIVFLPAATENDVPCKNLVIDNNNFVIDKYKFVICNIINGLTVSNNTITFGTISGTILIHAPYPTVNGDVKNIKLINNIFTSYSVFAIGTYAKNVGDLIISDNKMTFDLLASVPNGSSFNEVMITNNVIQTTGDRTYLSSSPVSKLTLKNNVINKVVSLYLDATNGTVISTDPCFKGYGYNSANPTVSGAGIINVLDNNNIYITDRSGSWHQVNNS